jgi:hypothetical protein
MKTFPHLTVNLLALALLSAASLRAASIPITNGTFDAANNTGNGGGNLALNQYTILFGTGVTVYDVPNNTSVGTADVPGFINVDNNYIGIDFVDPAIYFGPGGAPPMQPTGNFTLDGDVSSKALASSPDNVISNTNVAPNSTYTLTLDLYKGLDNVLPDTFQMQLFAGGVDLGGMLTVVMPTDTQPGSATLVVTTSGTVNNGALSFQLTSSVMNPIGTLQIFFDNLALDVVPNSAPLTLTDAVSRKTHGSAGTFDIELPEDGSGVECRNSEGSHEFVFTFSNAIVAGDATLNAPAGGSISGSPVISGNTMTVELIGVTNEQTITVTLSNVTDIYSQVLPDTAVTANMLTADTTGDKTVNLSDLNQVKGQAGMPVNATNFREDINVDGTITHADGRLVKQYRNTSLP